MTRELHKAGVGVQLTSGRRAPSLVDCVSFEVIRRMDLRTAFAFDLDSQEFGYESADQNLE